MPFQSLVESVLKLGLAPVLALYLVWYFTRQFDRLVAANETTSRAVQRIALHLNIEIEEPTTPRQAARLRLRKEKAV